MVLARGKSNALLTADMGEEAPGKGAPPTNASVVSLQDRRAKGIVWQPGTHLVEVCTHTHLGTVHVAASNPCPHAHPTLNNRINFSSPTETPGAAAIGRSRSCSILLHLCPDLEATRPIQPELILNV